MDKIAGVTALESNILLVVWDKSKVTAKVIHEIILKKEFKEKANTFTPYTTVMSTLNSLVNKNILKVDKSNKTYIYSAVVSKKELAKSIIKAVENKLL